MTRSINFLRTPWQLLAGCAVIIMLATGCLVMEAPCQVGQGKGRFDFRGIAVEPRAYSHLKNTFDRRVVTPENDTLYQVIQPYDTLFGLELATTDNDTLGRVPTYPGCKPYGYLYFIRSLDVVSNADWDADHPAGTSLNDLIDLKIALKDNPHYRVPLAEVNFIDLFSSIDNQGKTRANPAFIRMLLLFHAFPRQTEHHRLTVKMGKKTSGDLFDTSKDTVLVRSVNVAFE